MGGDIVGSYDSLVLRSGGQAGASMTMVRFPYFASFFSLSLPSSYAFFSLPGLVVTSKAIFN